jgi:hypothetical protein
LSADILSTDTSIDVDDGSVFPSTGDFRILIGSELMLVTARSTNTLTVVRGIEGTTAASHSNADGVFQSLTVGALKQYGRDNSPGFDGSRPPFRLLDAGSTIDSSDFSVVNASTSTITDQDGSIILRKASTSGQDLTLLARSYTAPKTVIVAMRAFWPTIANARVMAAVGFRESATGKLVFICLEANTTTLPAINGYYYSSPTVEAAARRLGKTFTQYSPELWFKATDDGTNITFYVGDGVNWVNYLTVARTDDFTSAPDQLIFGASSNTSSCDTITQLAAWSES